MIYPNAMLIGFVAALLLGCAQSKPFEYNSDTEITKRPGLFSGETGEYTVYSSSKSAAGAKQKQDAPGSVAAPEVSAPGAIDEAEFREFQQWRKERQDLEAFQEWKRTRQGTVEYEEFRDWQRWQNYKKWQESQSKDR